MPNSTAEYTDVDGVSLQTYAQNLRTWGDSREGVPPLRGDDQKIPYLPGRRFVRKIPDSRTITLEGWVLGSEVTEQVARRNHALNPNGVTTTGWTAYPGTGGTAALTPMPGGNTSWAGGTGYMHQTWSVGTADAASAAGAGIGYNVAVPGMPGTVGDIGSAAVLVRSTRNRTIRLQLNFRNGGAFTGTATSEYVRVTANKWFEFRVHGAVANAVYTNMQAVMQYDGSDKIDAGDALDMAVVTLEGAATSLGVFTPGPVDTDYVAYRWEGAADNSTQVQVMFNRRNSAQAAKNNWRALRKLLWHARRQVALTKRWYDAQGVLQTATALAQFAGGLEPDVMTGGSSLKFSVDLFLADPFFYGPEVTVTLVSGAQNVTILGDWPSLDGRLELVGSQGPTTVALGGTYAHQVTYGSAVAAGKTVTLDVLNFKATETGGVAKTVNVTHSGARFWFAAEPGVSSITVTRTGTGVLRYVYQPAWL